MNIELLIIGDELLLGFTVDTNSAHIARVLADMGVSVVRRTTVGDNPSHIGQALSAALERTGAVITTGGLGPTFDDKTHESIAIALGRQLVLHEAGLEALAERWRTRFGREMPASNSAQFMIPQGSKILANNHGSAPGIWLETESGSWLATLPGVPREMRGMLADEIVPKLRQIVESKNDNLSVVRSLTLRTTAISESALADRLFDVQERLEGIPLSYLPGVEGVDLRLTVSGQDSSTADKMLSNAEEVLRGHIGQWVYGSGNISLAQVVLEELRNKSLRLASAESCTGGLLSSRVCDVPGASSHFVGGIIAYGNEIKISHLGVSAEQLEQDGAVSETVARAMATGVKKRFSADVGLGITGIAGPGGGSEEKPVGTVWIAMDFHGQSSVQRTVFSGDRNEIRYRASQAALNMLYRALV